MATSTVPSLSAAGWLTSIAERADHVLACYLVSDHSESYVYEVFSLPWHVQQYGHDDLKLRNRMETDLNTLFRRHFTDVDLNINVDIPYKNEENKINIQLNVTVYEGDKQYSLGRLIKATRSRVLEVFDRFNG